MSDAVQWEWAGISGDTIVEKAVWLRAKRHLHSGSLRFFETAGSILVHARTDYFLISAAFFHAIIGVESALKLHYRKEKSSLAVLLERAIKDDLIQDSIFSEIKPLPDRIVPKQLRKLGAHHQKLAKLIPEWRNEYFHDGYILMPDYFHLTIQMREIADVLTTLETRR